MLFRAIRDCTDYNGRRFFAGEFAELPDDVRHSVYLVGAVTEKTEAEPVAEKTEAEPVAEKPAETVEQTPVRRKKRATRKAVSD